MLRTNKYRIYPNNKQIVLINRTFGSVRFVYNKMLNFRQDLYKQTLISYSKIDCNNWCNRVLKEEYSRSQCMGVYCYLPNETAYRADEEGSKLCKRDLGVPLLNL